MTKPSQPALLLIFIAALIWSTGGLFIKWSSLDAYQITFGRAVLAALTIAFLTRRKGFAINRTVIAGAVSYAVILFAFVSANKLTTAANAIFLQYTAPIFILVFEPLVYKEKFRVSGLLTILACVGGMSLFFVGKLSAGDVRGNLFALASGVAFAIYFLILRHPESQRMNPAATVIYGNLLLVILLLPVGVTAIRLLDWQNALFISYLGVVQIGVAYYLFTLGFSRGARSLDASIVSYIEPVLNPVWVFLVLRERPSQWAIVGGVVIVVAIVTHTIWRARQKRFESRVLSLGTSTRTKLDEVE